MALTVSHLQSATLQGINRPSSIGLFMSGLMISSDADDSRDSATAVSSYFRAARKFEQRAFVELTFLSQQLHEGLGCLEVAGFAGFLVDRCAALAEGAVHFLLKFGRRAGKQPGSDRFGCPQQKLAEKVERDVQPGTGLFGQSVIGLGDFQQRRKAVLRELRTELPATL